MGGKFSVRPEVQQFMDGNLVSKLSWGHQSVVYGGNGVVVKKFRNVPDLEVSGERAGVPGAYNTYKCAKDRLGGLASPFELAEGIRVRVVNASGSFDSQTFDRAVVQERWDSLSFIGPQLKMACIDGNMDRVMGLLRLFIDFRMQLLQRGAYLNDPNPYNIVVASDSEMLLADIGAVKFMTRQQAVGVASAWFYGLAGWIAFLHLRAAVSGDARKKLGKDWGDFKDKFKGFYDPEVLEKIYPCREAVRAMNFSGGKHRRSEANSLRVPDVRLPKHGLDKSEISV